MAYSVGSRQRQALAAAAGDARNQAVYFAADALTRMVVDAVRADTRFKTQMLISLAEVFKRPQTDFAERERIHREIAKLAQRSVIQSYAQLVTAREGPASRSHYRVGAGRLAGGVMLRALGRPDFVEAAADGIRFANTTMLDQQAKHWHRLAFGAEGRGQGSDVHFEVRWGSLVVGALGYDETPSPGFRLPAGLWINAEGKAVPAGANPRGADRFFPVMIFGGRQRGPQSAGIEGRDFFAPGLRRIATEFPRAYEQYYNRLYQQFQQGRGPLTRINVPVGTPRRLPVTVRRR